MSVRQAEYYKGIRMAPYDLIGEGLISLVVVGLLIGGVSALFSSADEAPLTASSVAVSDPPTFLATALGQLDGSDSIASYGPPYNTGTGSVQSIGSISLQRLAGVRIPIDPAEVDVLRPLRLVAAVKPDLTAALASFDAAAPKQRASWEAAYGEALKKVKMNGGSVVLPQGDYGPVAPMLSALLDLGRSGLLEGAIDHSPRITTTDNTRSLLFLQATALPALAEKYHLIGSQWGMMNETGNYPGQAWLWLYTFWYQVPLVGSSANADLIVWLVMALLTLALLFMPWIPGLNRLPKLLGVYRVIWRDYYRETARAGKTP